jgi:hypothetical protein
LIIAPLACGDTRVPDPPAQEACTGDEAPPPGSPAEQLHWLVGTWVATDDGTTTTERWCATEDGSLAGDNRTVDASGREVHSERIRISARGDDLVYTASPSGQATTEFTGRTRCGSDTMGNCETTCEAVFENPAHDFPKTITYGRCLQNEFLVATIAGTDEQRRASWTFRRRE